MRSHRLPALIACALALLLPACATHKPYRSDNSAPGCVGSKSSVWKDPDTGTPYLGFVEFDDMGERWDSSKKEGTQVQTVTKAISTLAAGNKPIFLIVFAHGWANDASDKNIKGEGNLFSFNKKIQELRGFHENDHIAVFGVYLGWRGKTPIWPLDFYHRNEGGRRVGERATGAVFDLIAAARKSNQSKIAVIGHSFGAHVIEGAVTNPLQADVSRAWGSQQEMKPIADLVLLVNPARSSSFSKPLIDQLRSEPVKVSTASTNSDNASSEQKRSLPLIVSVTSKGDWATHDFFPFGYWLGRGISQFNTGVDGQYRKDASDPVAQGKTHKRTLGWNTALHSHTVDEHTYSGTETPPGCDLRKIVSANQKPWGEDQKTIIVRGAKQKYSITRNIASYNDTPYWAMQVPDSIVEGHNGIWGDDYVGLVTALLYLPNAESPSAASSAPAQKLFSQPLSVKPGKY